MIKKSIAVPAAQSLCYLNPEVSEKEFIQAVSEMARQGIRECVIAGRPRSLSQRRKTGLWIKKLKLDYPGLDFHYAPGGFSR